MDGHLQEHNHDNMWYYADHNIVWLQEYNMLQ